MDFTWIKGPTSDTKALGVDQRAHKAATHRETTRWGHTRGPADPRIDLTDLGAPIGTLHVVSLIGHLLHPGVFWSTLSLRASLVLVYK
jgi:hypothetical protein